MTDPLFDRAHAIGLAHLESLKVRGEAQLAFAAFLLERDPALPSPAVAEARAILARGLAAGRVDELADAVAALEAALAPFAPAAKRHTIHAVGHAHIDMNWIFSWPETVATTCDTLGTVLRLMEEFPEFHFSQDQAAIYQIVAEHEPELLERIRARVREGRWEVMASHWVEGDKNLVGAESLVRHLLETRAYMAELFGLAPEDAPVAWNPDAFGHAADLPALLADGAVRYYVFARPGAGAFDSIPRYPPLFRWRARQGATLIAACLFNGYNNAIRPTLLPHAMRFYRESGRRDFLCSIGIGDHGGGPTRQDLLYAREMRAWPCFPELRFTTARAYFEALAPEAAALPEVTGELNHEMEGCYTSGALIKKCNAIAENQCAVVETFAGVAQAAAGLAVDPAILRACWRDTLFAQFHDILPGSGIMETRTFAHGRWQASMARAGRLETRALRALCAAIDTSAVVPVPHPALPVSHAVTSMGSGAGRGALRTGTSYPAGDGQYATGASLMDQAGDPGLTKPYVLFNPCGQPFAGVATAVVWDYAAHRGAGPARLAVTPLAVDTGAGVPVSAQVLEQGDYWGHHYTTIAFPVDAVPGLGHRLVTVREESTAPAPCAAATQVTVRRWGHGAFTLENDVLALRVDADTGAVTSLVEKAGGVEFAAPGFLRLEAATERHNWRGSAWVFGEGESAVEPLVLVAMKAGLTGPYMASLVGHYRWRASEFRVHLELRAGEPLVYVRIEGLWQEAGSAERGVPQLRLAMPTALHDLAALAESPGGATVRAADGQEFPAVQWCRIAGTATDGRPAGLLLVNEGKHGHRLSGATLRLTLLRSSFDPDPLPEVGEHRMHLALQPFAGAMLASACAQAALRVHRPLRAVSTGIHPGTLPARAAALQGLPDNLEVLALKPAADGNGWILRVREWDGVDTEATAAVDSRLIGRLVEAVATDLLERPRAGAPPLAAAGQNVTFRCDAHGVTTIRLMTDT